MSTELLCKECGDSLYELEERETGLCKVCLEELNNQPIYYADGSKIPEELPF